MRPAFHIAIAVVCVAVGAGAALHWLGHSDPTHYIDMQRASHRASEEVSMNYWNDERPEAAACPRHVPAIRGQVFWCQVLLTEHVVPVEMQLRSPLGFFKVVKVGENRALVREGRVEHQELVEEREEREARALAAAASWEHHCYEKEHGDWLRFCLTEAREMREH